MNSAPFRFPAPSAMIAAAAVFFGFAAAPVLAGEKATISVPSKPSGAGNPGATRPTTATPLSPGTSSGGSVDSPATPGAIPQTIPDARTQKELMERLDRKRNWLLDDGSKAGKSPGANLLLEALDEPDYSSNPRRPKTALERRLKAGNSTPGSDSNVREHSNQESESGFDTDAFGDRPGSNWGSQQIRNGLSPASTAGTASLIPGFQSPTADLSSVENLRSSLTATLGRNAGMDSLSQQRLERYQRTFGTDDLGERTSSLAASVDHSRTRESRSELMGQPLRTGPDMTSAAGSGLARDGAPPVPSSLVRSPLPTAASQGMVVNPYLGPPAAPEPYQSPAAKLLKSPPAEPPRFRP